MYQSPNTKIAKKRQYPEMFNFIINRACLTFLIVRQTLKVLSLSILLLLVTSEGVDRDEVD